MLRALLLLPALLAAEDSRARRLSDAERRINSQSHEQLYDGGLARGASPAVPAGAGRGAATRLNPSAPRQAGRSELPGAAGDGPSGAEAAAPGVAAELIAGDGLGARLAAA